LSGSISIGVCWRWAVTGENVHMERVQCHCGTGRCISDGAAMSDNGLTFTMRYHGVPVYVSDMAPLRKTKQPAWDDYEHVEIETDALCVIVGGAVYIHPERMQMLEDAGLTVQQAISR
jgi:hypothetical protein